MMILSDFGVTVRACMMMLSSRLRLCECKCGSECVSVGVSVCECKCGSECMCWYVSVSVGVSVCAGM